MPNYKVFILFGIISIALAIGVYALANLSTEYNIPKGAMSVGIGPQGNMTPVSTKIVFRVSAPYSKMNLEIFFNFTEFKKYHIYVTMPYETLEAKPYVIYQEYHHYNDTISQIGNISLHFKNFAEKKSSAINATFIPIIDFPFEGPIALSIEATVSNLVSINYPLNSKQTVILTFFGGQGAIWDNEFVQYTGLDKIEMMDYPFQVIIKFPTENYLASDTFPTPIALYVTEGFRSAIFDMNFSYRYPEWRGKSISCSFSNPRRETERNLFTFVSGTLLGVGLTSSFESIREARKLRKKKTSQQEKPSDQREEPKESYNETIIRLIRLVDSNFKFTQFDFFLRGENAFPFVAVVVFLVLISVFNLVFAPSLYERIVVGTSFLAFTVAFLSLLARFGEEHIVNVNFKRFGICVEGNKKPLLKALIKMKVKHSEFDLEQIYNLDKSMFIKEKLLERLYER